MDTVPLASSLNRKRLLIFLLLLLLGLLWGCEKKEGAREEASKEQKVPIGIITTTNYCQGIMTSADVKVKPGYIALSHDIEKQHKLKFGDLIYLEGETEPYEFMDRMPPQWERRADLYVEVVKTPGNTGCRRGCAGLLESNKGVIHRVLHHQSFLS